MVLQGLDIMEKEGFSFLKEKRVGLITNYSFVDRDLRSGLDTMIKNGVRIVKIFAPEHGLFALPDGLEYEDFKHPKYGMPVVSLFGRKKKPSEEDLSDVDVLVYDIQDVGLRYYTFIYTLAYTLESAAENGIPYVVLDRINPLGGYIVGPRIPDEMSSFVGGYKLPLRYGLTPGELALYFKKLEGLDVDLKIVKLEGWNRDMMFDETGLIWNVPSPNLPTFESAICYAGMCLIEGTNLSEGRGTTKPFQYIGAPWFRDDVVYEEMKSKNLKGVNFRKREFIPRFSKYQGELCWGLEFVPIEKNVNFFKVTLEFLSTVMRHHEEFEVRREWLDKLSGDPELVEDLKTGNVENALNRWKSQEEEFMDYVDDILLYPGKLRRM